MSIKVYYYCGLPATTIDHVVPQKLLKMLASLNDKFVTNTLIQSGRTLLVDSCQECNSALGSRYDETLLARRRRAKAFIRRKYRKFLESPSWTEQELSKLEPRLRQYVIAGLNLKQLTNARLMYRRGGKDQTRELVSVQIVVESLSKQPHGKSTVVHTASLPRLGNERKREIYKIALNSFYNDLFIERDESRRQHLKRAINLIMDLRQELI